MSRKAFKFPHTPQGLWGMMIPARVVVGPTESLVGLKPRVAPRLYLTFLRSLAKRRPGMVPRRRDTTFEPESRRGQGGFRRTRFHPKEGPTGDLIASTRAGPLGLSGSIAYNGLRSTYIDSAIGEKIDTLHQAGYGRRGFGAYYLHMIQRGRFLIL